MKKLQLLIALILISNAFAQENISLEQAVLERWTTLRPDRLMDLNWNNEQDFYSYKDQNNLYLSSIDNLLNDTITLEQLNYSFEGEDVLNSIPSVTWISQHSFIFKNKNKYFTYNTQRGSQSSLLFDLPNDAENVDFNNQNNILAYTKENNLYILKDGSQSTSITDELSKDIIYGQAVHRYEFGVYKGTFWSNSSDYLAFYRKDESMVTDYPLMNISSRVGHADIIKYPMAGMNSHHVSLGVYDVKNNTTIYLETGEPKEQYLTNICWGPDDKYIYVAVLNRDQNHLKLNQYNVEDGSFVMTLFEEKSDKYVQPLHPMEFISSDQFLWRSERDGYDNFFLYNTSGRLLKKVSNKNHVVKDFYGYKDDNIYFSAYSKDGLSIDLWVVSIDKRYRKKIINDGNYHQFKISPSKEFFIDKFTNINTPGVTRIINWKGLIEKDLLVATDPLDNYNIGETSLFNIKTEDNTSLNCRLIKPYNFDSSKKYPVLIYVYNGPGVQLLNNNWLAGSPLWMYYLANLDYIIFTVDGRGSENRGRDFEQSIYGELGKVEMIDQLKGYDYLLELPYVDASRIAVHGWSYGGFMTTNLLLNHPNLFTCGVAGGPVTNWEYYEVMYTERYMGHPDSNNEGYKKTNLMNQVHLLEDPLLMIHGLVDDVVLPKHSLDFIKASVDKNIQMDYFIYPGHPHNVRGKDRLHLIQKIIDYIRENN